MARAVLLLTRRLLHVRIRSLLSNYTDRNGLRWAPGDNLVRPNADELRQDVMHKMHDYRILDTLVSLDQHLATVER